MPVMAYITILPFKLNTWTPQMLINEHMYRDGLFISVYNKNINISRQMDDKVLQDILKIQGSQMSA